MKAPKLTDGHRFNTPYTPVAEQGDGYLKRRFEEIRERQKIAARERLEKCVEMKRRSR